MSLPIQFLPEAKAEFDAAADWYESKRAGLGLDFIRRVREVFVRIAGNPRLHAKVYREVRRAIVSKFPYVVLYQEEPNQVLVISIFHASRDPSIWKSRV
jgi:plasmid stabilization system protein ParE